MAYITLNKSAFFHNLDIIAQQTKSIDKIALVLKDNAYGHGLLPMAKMAQEYGITKCVVRDECEADEVSEYFNDILILSPRIYSDNQKFIYTINDYSDLENIKYKDLNIALKVDSGMHRNGVIVEELEDALSCIEKSSLTLHSVFTHFRSADSLSSEWFWQNKNYHDIKKNSRRKVF